MAFLYVVHGCKSWNDFVRVESLTDDELFQSTRFPRQAVHKIIDLLHDDLKRQTEWSHAVPVSA